MSGCAVYEVVDDSTWEVRPNYRTRYVQVVSPAPRARVVVRNLSGGSVRVVTTWQRDQNWQRHHHHRDSGEQVASIELADRRHRGGERNVSRGQQGAPRLGAAPGTQRNRLVDGRAVQDKHDLRIGPHARDRGVSSKAGLARHERPAGERPLGDGLARREASLEKAQGWHRSAGTRLLDRPLARLPAQGAYRTNRQDDSRKEERHSGSRRTISKTSPSSPSDR